MGHRQSQLPVVILGGGPTGLSIAWHLSRQSVPVVALEKSEHLGGLCRTMQVDGYRFDFGPHNLHTHRQDIITFLKKILGENLIPKNFRVKIYFNNQLVDYPLRGLNALKVLPPLTKVTAIWDLFFARVGMFLRNPKKDDSFEAWITNRFGRTLYNIYFGPYAQKAWKIPADQISAYVAAKRVPIISLTDYARKLFRLEPKKFHSEFGKTVQSFYPRHGIGEVVDYFIRELKGTEARIEMQSVPREIHWEPGKITKVLYESNQKQVELKTRFLFSSIPLNELIGLLRPLPPQEVLEAARGLDFSAERLLYIMLDREEVFDVPLVYFQDPKISFNRVYDVRVFSPECVPSGKNALCVEFTCSQTDPIFDAPDEVLFEEALAVFEAKGILKRGEVIRYFSKRVTHAYPRFRIGFQQRLKTLFEFLSQFHNAVTLGRQGLFCYANVDEVLAMSFRALEYFNTLDYRQVDYYSLFEEHIDHE